jgi:hypothetical protein
MRFRSELFLVWNDCSGWIKVWVFIDQLSNSYLHKNDCSIESVYFGDFVNYNHTKSSRGNITYCITLFVATVVTRMKLDWQMIESKASGIVAEKNRWKFVQQHQNRFHRDINFRCGVRLSPFILLLQMSLFISPWSYKLYGQLVEGHLSGENGRVEGNWLVVLLTTNHTRTHVGLNPVLRGEKSTTNCMS